MSLISFLRSTLQIPEDLTPVSEVNPLPVAGGGTATAPAAGVASEFLVNFQQDTFPLVLSLDTNAYATAEVLADTQALVLMASPPAGGLRGEVTSITVLDKDDTGGLLDVVVLNSDVSLGTEGSAVSISDTDAEQIAGIVPVTSFRDLVNSQLANPDFAPIPFKVAAGTLYLGAISRDAKTYTAAGIRLLVTVRFHNAGLLT